VVGDILQPTHLLFILVIALLVLGPKRLPEVGKSLGKGLRDFRMAISGEEHDQPTDFMGHPGEQPTPVAMAPAATASAPPAPAQPTQTPAASTPAEPAQPEPADAELVHEEPAQADPVAAGTPVSASAPAAT
jgi:sec-independent protein translocase protein TatA